MMTYILLTILLLVQLFLLTHLQFTAWPEMLSYPYLRNNGFLLYKDMIHPYPPLLTIILSVIYSLFGFSVKVLQFSTWVLLLSNSILVFYLLKILTKKDNLAVLGLGAYVLLQPFLEGNMLWFDTAVVTPLLLSNIFLLKWLDKKSWQNILLSGLFLSFAIFTKQTVGLYFLLLLPFLFYQKAKAKQVVLFLSPAIFMGAALLVRLLQERAFLDFMNWTLVYPFLYWSKFPGYVQMSISMRDLLIIAILLSPLSILLFRFSLLKETKLQLLLLYLLASLASVYPRFSFFHFQSALAFCVIISLYLKKDKNNKFIYASSILTMIVLGYLIYKPTLNFYWQKEARFYSSDDVKIATMIQNVSLPEHKIYLLGLPSQYYVISERLPPKRWSDNFGWYLEIPGVQEEILYRWENDSPDTIFRKIPNQGNWFDLGTYQPQKIVDYMRKNYILVEIDPLSKIERWQKNKAI